MSEYGHVLDGCESAVSGSFSIMEPDGDHGMDEATQHMEAAGAEEDDATPPSASGARMPEAVTDGFSQRAADENRESGLQVVQEGVANAVETTGVVLPTEPELENRVEVICLGGEGPPEISCGRIAGLTATNALIDRVISVVDRVFHNRKSEVRWVTPLAQLDRMEAYAYLLADLLRGELLLEEANAIGKRAHKHVKVDVQKQIKALWGDAKSDRSNARRAAKKDLARAAALDQLLSDIDQTRDAMIADLWQEVYEGLDLPAENTVLVTRQQPERSGGDLEGDSGELKMMQALSDTITEALSLIKQKNSEFAELEIAISRARRRVQEAGERLQKCRKNQVPDRVEESREASEHLHQLHRLMHSIESEREDAYNQFTAATDEWDRLSQMQKLATRRVEQALEREAAVRQLTEQRLQSSEEKLELAVETINAKANAELAATGRLHGWMLMHRDKDWAAEEEWYEENFCVVCMHLGVNS